MRQKRQDLLTQLAVSVQGYLALDLIRRNNVELIKGVDRATTTTISALRTAVIVAQALSDQKLVLDQITALNTTTGDLIESTSEMLHQQSGQISEQAASATIDLAKLQKAFQNIYMTMDEIDTFKVKALDNMQTTITALETELDKSQTYVNPIAPCRCRAAEHCRPGWHVGGYRSLDSDAAFESPTVALGAYSTAHVARVGNGLWHRIEPFLDSRRNIVGCILGARRLRPVRCRRHERRDRPGRRRRPVRHRLLRDAAGARRVADALRPQWTRARFANGLERSAREHPLSGQRRRVPEESAASPTRSS